MSGENVLRWNFNFLKSSWLHAFVFRLQLKEDVKAFKNVGFFVYLCTFEYKVTFC